MEGQRVSTKMSTRVWAGVGTRAKVRFRARL